VGINRPVIGFPKVREGREGGGVGQDLEPTKRHTQRCGVGNTRVAGLPNAQKWIAGVTVSDVRVCRTNMGHCLLCFLIRGDSAAQQGLLVALVNILGRWELVKCCIRGGESGN